MKFSHALILASSLAFFACGGDDDDSPTGAKAGYDCTVSDGVKVAYPTGGETFKVGDEITVVFGTTVAGQSYSIAFRKAELDNNYDLVAESFDLKAPADGMTCHTMKVKLDAEKGVVPTNTGFIRVYPYDSQRKGANSKPFVVKE